MISAICCPLGFDDSPISEIEDLGYMDTREINPGELAELIYDICNGKY